MLETGVLVEVTRGGTVESRHHGVIAVVTGRGKAITGVGGADSTTFVRSAAKPIQALPLLTSGAEKRFKLAVEELALMAGSHSGQPRHVRVAGAILERIGCTLADLRCGTHPPFDAEAARALNEPPTALHNNCSGKHAGMLALARHLGADISAYDRASHPVQQIIREAVRVLTDTDEQHLVSAVDGCGVPTFALSMRRLALAYARLAAPEAGNLPPELCKAARRITLAMTECPEMVAGTNGRLDTDLMAVCGRRLFAKVGAEGVHALGVFPTERYPDGLGMAVKIEDGDDRRVRNIVVTEALLQLGLLAKEEVDLLASHGPRPVQNHRGDTVGWIRPAFRLV